MKAEILKQFLNIATQTLQEEKKDNGYPFACGVMKSTIQSICKEYDIDTTEFISAFNKHVSR